jgi:hypothetical protein
MFFWVSGIVLVSLRIQRVDGSILVLDNNQFTLETQRNRISFKIHAKYLIEERDKKRGCPGKRCSFLLNS